MADTAPCMNPNASSHSVGPDGDGVRFACGSTAFVFSWTSRIGSPTVRGGGHVLAE